MSNGNDSNVVTLPDVGGTAEKFKRIGENLTTKIRNKPKLLSLLRKIDKDQFARYKIPSKDYGEFLELKLLAPDLFKEFKMQTQGGWTGIGQPGIKEKISPEASWENKEAQLGFIDISAEDIEAEKNKRHFWEKFGALLNTGERMQAGSFMEMAKRGTPKTEFSVPKTFEEINYTKTLKQLKDYERLKGAEPKKMPMPLTEDWWDWIFRIGKYKTAESITTEKGYKEGIEERLPELLEAMEEAKPYEEKRMFQVGKEAALNKPEYQDMFFEDLFKMINPLGETLSDYATNVLETPAAIPGEKIPYTEYMNTRDIDMAKKDYQIFKNTGLAGKDVSFDEYMAKFAPEKTASLKHRWFGTHGNLAKFGAVMTGSPNAQAGLIMGLIYDTLPEAFGMAFGFGASKLGDLIKVSKAFKAFKGTAFAKKGSAMLKAFSAVKKTEPEKIAKQLELELLHEAKLKRAEVAAIMNKVRKGEKKPITKIGEQITSALESPKYTIEEIIEDVVYKKPFRKKVTEYVTEIAGDQTYARKLRKTLKQLDEVKIKLEPYKNKIVKNLEAQAMYGVKSFEYEGKQMTPIQAFRKYIKEQGGIKFEKVKVGGTEVMEEYSEISKYYKWSPNSKKIGIAADEIPRMLDAEVPGLRAVLNMQDVEKGTDYLELLKKGYTQPSGFIPEEDVIKILADNVEADLEKQMNKWIKAGEKGQFKPEKGSLTDLYFGKQELTEVADELTSKVVMQEGIDIDKFAGEYGKPLYDIGTGKETVAKRTKYITDYVEKIKHQRTKVTKPVKFKVAATQEAKEYIEGGYKQLADEWLKETGQDISRKSYTPGMPTLGTIEEMPVKGKQVNILDAFGEQKPFYTKEKKFTSTLQRQQFGKLSTDRNAFSGYFRRWYAQERSMKRFELGRKIQDLAAPDSTIIKKVQHLVGDEKLIWRKVENIPELKGYYMPDEFAKVIENAERFVMLDDVSRAVLNRFDKTLHLLKGYMTVANAGFHLRNFYSNFWHLFLKDSMGAFDPNSHAKAQAMFLARKNPDMPINVGGKYGIMKASEVMDMFGRKGLINTGFMRSSIAEDVIRQLEYDMLPRYKKVITRINPVSRNFFVLHYGDIFGGFVENEARMVGAFNSLAKGESFDEAITNTLKFMIDYSDLSVLERNIGRRGFPFYSWLRKNTALEIQQAFKQPKKFAMLPKLRNYVETLSETEFDYPPDFFDNLWVLKMPFGLEADGSLVFGKDLEREDVQQLGLNPNFPFQDVGKLSGLAMIIADLIEGHPERIGEELVGAGKEVMSALNPIFKILMELGFNKESFFERPIDTGLRNRYAPAPMQALGDIVPFEKMPFVERKEDTGDLYMSGRSEYLSRQIPFLYNLYKAAPPTEAEQEYRDIPKYITSMLSTFGGAKFFPYDKKRQEDYHYKDLLSLAGKETTQKQLMMPEGEELLQQDEISKALRALYEKQIRGETGMENIEDIEYLMSLMGGSQEERLMLQLAKEPYKEKKAEITGMSLAELTEYLASIGIKPTEKELRAILEEMALEG